MSGEERIQGGEERNQGGKERNQGDSVAQAEFRPHPVSKLCVSDCQQTSVN